MPTPDLDGVRVLALTPRLWPVDGAGRQRTEAFVAGFAEAGARVTAIVPYAGTPPSAIPRALASVDIDVVRDPLSRLPWQAELALEWLGVQDRAVVALRRAERHRRSERFDVVFASAAPFSAASAAARLAASTQTPLFLDLRDEWAGNPFDTKQGPLHRALEHRRENRAMPHVSAVSAPIPEIFEAFDQPYHGVTRVIEHGCHKDEITAGVGDPPALPGDGRLTIVYAGMRYGLLNEDDFLDTYTRIADPPPLRLVLVGAARPITRPLPSAMTVEVVPHVPHVDLLRHYARAHAVLNFVPPRSVARGPRSKFEEYKATGRPILSLAPPDSQLYRMTSETPGGYAVASGPSAPGDLHDALIAIREAARAGVNYRSQRVIRTWRDVGNDAAATVSQIISHRHD